MSAAKEGRSRSIHGEAIDALNTLRRALRAMPTPTPDRPNATMLDSYERMLAHIDASVEWHLGYTAVLSDGASSQPGAS